MPNQVALNPTVDFALGRANSSLSWPEIVASASNNTEDELLTTMLAIYWFNAANPNMWRSLRRGLLRFDFSDIPVTATILSAILYLYCSSKRDDDSQLPNVNIYGGTSSFQAAGSTPFSTTVSYSDLSTTGYTSFPFNSDGLDYIKDNLAASPPYFVIRNANYDVAINSPTWPTEAEIRFYTRNASAQYRPYIVVTYSTSGSPANNQVVTGLRHIYSKAKRRYDLEITFGGYSTREDIIAPEIAKIVDEETIPQVPEKDKTKLTKVPPPELGWSVLTPEEYKKRYGGL